MNRRSATAMVGVVLGLVVRGGAASGAEAPPRPLQVSGIYPHLAMFNEHGECGIGAVVPWAGKLWVITYPPHMRQGSTDKLYEIDPATMAVTIRPESVGGTHANRMIHRESNQLIIGPHFIDAQGTVRTADVRNKLIARLTATARDLTDPKNHVLFFDMEGPVYRVNVNTLDVQRLFVKPAPGWHGKGAYTGQGVFVIGNNGESQGGGIEHWGPFESNPQKWSKGLEEAGCLAEWNGEYWLPVLRRQFLDVTGPGGIYGPPVDAPGAPIWSIGWDKRSCLLAVRDPKASATRPWSFFRLPKASHTYDPKHGYYTEWPRIREINSGRFIITLHGMMFDFPGAMTKPFRPGQTAGVRPVCSYLRYIPDFAFHDGRLILAADDTSIMQNPMAGVSQSNLWFGTPEQLAEFGPAAGWGGVWLNDAVKPDQPSDPYLFGGFAKRVLHLSHKGTQALKVRVEVDERGDGQWAAMRTVEVPPGGYQAVVFPPDARGEWVRLKADQETTASAFFHYLTPSKYPAGNADPAFAAVPKAGDGKAWTGGVVRPGKERELQLVARSVDAAGNAGPEVYYELDESLNFKRVDDANRPAAVHKVADVTGADFTVDEASVIVTLKGGRLRLPKGDAAFDKAGPLGWPRGVREVQSERNLANLHGTFYEIPRGGEKTAGGFGAEWRQIKPVATHNRVISDFCTWRGLLVLAGTAAGARPDGHYFAAGEGGPGLWFGAVDDLWRLGKPVGRGGPWMQTAVEAGKPSDAYLMTNYDRKRVELSHDAAGPVTFTLEVDTSNTRNWQPCATVTVPAGQTTRHEFPDGFSAYWVRVTADKACKATATFVYE